MTEKLYYSDSHMRSFTASITELRVDNGKFYAILDRTAFFPEGGGQTADTGVIGGVDVLDVQEKKGEILHLIAAPLPIGTQVLCEINWDKRFRNMQNHSGEHIVSGIVNNLYGYNNVGFHMGEDGVIIDFDGYLSPDELADIELRANRIIWDNRKVTTYFPSSEELAYLKYRSKLDITENVRIVTIDGCDVCACCAPHVLYTGEIGVIKLFDSIRRRGGVRVRMLAGADAFRDYAEKCEQVSAVSALLSAKQDAISVAVERLKGEVDRMSYELGGFKRDRIKTLADSVSETDGNLLFFEPLFSSDELRLLVNSVIDRCGGVCAAFAGDDENGYNYILASGSSDMKIFSRAMNDALSGRGGGNSRMSQGHISATRQNIEEYFGF